MRERKISFTKKIHGDDREIEDELFSPEKKCGLSQIYFEFYFPSAKADGNGLAAHAFRNIFSLTIYSY